jgi:hypothetical protein
MSCPLQNCGKLPALGNDTSQRCNAITIACPGGGPYIIAQCVMHLILVVFFLAYNSACCIVISHGLLLAASCYLTLASLITEHVVSDENTKATSGKEWMQTAGSCSAIPIQPESV